MSAPLGLRGRIAVTAMVASGAALLAVLLLVGPRLRENTLEHTRAELFANARLWLGWSRSPSRAVRPPPSWTLSWTKPLETCGLA